MYVKKLYKFVKTGHLIIFLFKYSSISHIALYGMMKILHVCDWRLTRIIRIKQFTHKNVALRYIKGTAGNSLNIRLKDHFLWKWTTLRLVCNITILHMLLKGLA